jgi:hypothetical protein
MKIYFELHASRDYVSNVLMCLSVYSTGAVYIPTATIIGTLLQAVSGAGDILFRGEHFVEYLVFINS